MSDNEGVEMELIMCCEEAASLYGRAYWFDYKVQDGDTFLCCVFNEDELNGKIMEYCPFCGAEITSSMAPKKKKKKK